MGAPVPRIAAAVAPSSEADAAKRIFDAAKPLKAAGVPVRDALAEVAAQMRRIVHAPMPKGGLSARLAEVMPAPTCAGAASARPRTCTS